MGNQSLCESLSFLSKENQAIPVNNRHAQIHRKKLKEINTPTRPARNKAKATKNLSAFHYQQAFPLTNLIKSKKISPKRLVIYQRGSNLGLTSFVEPTLKIHLFSGKQ